jgi:hypothetical protein
MKKALLVLPVLLLVPACIFVVDADHDDWDWIGSHEVVHGSGNPASETRALSPFHRIVAHDSIDVDVKIGETQSVAVRADDNLVEWVRTSVDDGTLEIRWRSRHGKGSSTRSSPRVDIVVRSLDGLEMCGSGDARVSGLKGDSFVIALSGSGDARAEGAVERLTVELSGTGDADLFGLEARAVEVSLSGSGDAEVTARESLRADISGSGDVDYRGDPKSVKREISGSGDLERAGG